MCHFADLGAAKAYYASLGFHTLPLWAGTKDPLRRAWPTRAPEAQWRDAPQDSNIGLRCGGPGEIAILDGDDKSQAGSAVAIQNWLAGLGYPIGSYPLYNTASQVGRQILLTFEATLGGSSRTLSKRFAAGEFKFGSGAFGVAPPSVVEGRSYRLLTGNFERLPRLSLADILPILQNKSISSSAPNQPLPSLPRKALLLLDGKGVEAYASRSEVEQAIVTVLVNAGMDFAAILRLFQEHHPQPAKFHELYQGDPQNAIRWLRLSYNNAVQWAYTNTSEGRRRAEVALAWAESRAWPGRAGSIDKRVFLAHADIAERAGRVPDHASARSSADLADAARRRQVQRLIVWLKTAAWN